MDWDEMPLWLKAILFVPVIIIGGIMYTIDDFKNHKAGYICVYLLIAFIIWGMVMGYLAGPESPPPWDYD